MKGMEYFTREAIEKIYEGTKPSQKLTLKCKSGQVYFIERDELKYSKDALFDICKILNDGFWGDIALTPEGIRTKETIKPKDE